MAVFLSMIKSNVMTSPAMTDRLLPDYSLLLQPWKENSTETALDFTFLRMQNITKNCHITSNSSSYLPWRNDKQLLSYENVLQGEKIVNCILTPIICLFGIAANVLNCVVFYKQGLRHRIHFLLFSHSCTDLVFSVYIFLFFSDRFYLHFISQYVGYGDMASLLTNSGLHTLYGFTYASGFLSTYIAIERCLCIVWPFSADWLMRTKNVCVIVCVATASLVCAHYIAAERYKIVCVYDVQSDVLVYTFFPSDFYVKHSFLVNIMTGVLYGLGLPSIFIVVTIITTIITAVHLQSAAQWSQGARKQSAVMKEVFVTKMLISTSCLFIACKTPDILIRITPLFVPDFKIGGYFQNLFLTFVYIIMLTTGINASFNICIYFKMGSKYRQTLKSVCRQISLSLCKLS